MYLRSITNHRAFSVICQQVCYRSGRSVDGLRWSGCGTSRSGSAHNRHRLCFHPLALLGPPEKQPEAVEDGMTTFTVRTPDIIPYLMRSYEDWSATIAAMTCEIVLSNFYHPYQLQNRILLSRNLHNCMILCMDCW